MVYCKEPMTAALKPGTAGNCCGGSYECVYNCSTVGGEWEDARQEWCCAKRDVGCAPEAPRLPGSDRDEGGCIHSAGFRWCATQKACYRSWERKEMDRNQDGHINSDEFDHHCNNGERVDEEDRGNARERESDDGEAEEDGEHETGNDEKREEEDGEDEKEELEEEKSGEEKKGEEEERADAAYNGGGAPTVQEHSFGKAPEGMKCLASAGYQWCESEQKCVRWFEMVDAMDTDKDQDVSIEEFGTYCFATREEQGMRAPKTHVGSEGTPHSAPIFIIFGVILVIGCAVLAFKSFGSNTRKGHGALRSDDELKVESDEFVNVHAEPSR